MNNELVNLNIQLRLEELASNGGLEAIFTAEGRRSWVTGDEHGRVIHNTAVVIRPH